jgi:hypothetical protein
VICQCCGVEAPTKYVEFYQNIGALLVRFHKSIKGKLCKSCINKYFWEFTMTNLTLGWWGTISFIMTPFLIINNVIRYLGALKLQPVPIGATAPTLTEEVMDKLNPYTDELFSRINGEESIEQVVQSIAPRVGVTPGQIFLYLHTLVQSAEEQN